jgi:hypothetical protein
LVAKARTVAFHGVEVIEVETQVTIASGLPAFTVVGLPDKAVAESRERVRAALASLGLGLPPRRITVNLAPANVLKERSQGRGVRRLPEEPAALVSREGPIRVSMDKGAERSSAPAPS